MGNCQPCCCCCRKRPNQHEPHQLPPFQPNPPNPKALKLPYCHVDSSLKALAGQAEGFGSKAVGGLDGELYHVTTLADDGPGSLRYGCRQNKPLWIVFDVSGNIHLNSYMSVPSHTTIDGRGQRVKITGKGFRLKECKNVIICNLEFEGGRGHDVDAIQIKPKSEDIWIDRCSLRDYDDGLIDVCKGSTNITISRCHFSSHDKTILIGADRTHTEDRNIRVTIHHCFFDETRQRHPRVRFGKVHLYNNYTRNWDIYAVCASVESEIYSECNIYEAGTKKQTFLYYGEQAADKEEKATGRIRSEGDSFFNGADAKPIYKEDSKTSEGEHVVKGAEPKTQLHKGGVFHPSQFYDHWTVEAPGEHLKHVLQHCTGWQNLPQPPMDSN